MIEIKNYDFSNFDDYRKLYGYDCSCAANETAPVEHILREWAKAKNKYLARMFDDQLILERPIKYEAAEEDKIRLMDMLLREDFARQFVRDFEHNYYNFFNTSYNEIYYTDGNKAQQDIYDTFRICSCILDSSYLLINNMLPEYLAVRKMVIINPNDPRDKVQIQTGEKALRVLSKVSKMIGMADEFEQFRIKLSQVTNVKDMHGILCLSIHPLDYATASDNANGWSSCMSWQDSGCYRMGTVEMMNSPMVICAYVKSEHTTMSFMNRDDYNCRRDHVWNSKKWRCWVICNEDLVVCGKNYPYESKAVEKLVINWVKELAGERLGWTYDNTVEDIYKYMDVSGLDTSNVSFDTNYMYNDFDNNPTYPVVGALTERKSIFREWRSYNYSGEAECMCCGKIVDFDDSNIGSRADSLVCVDIVDCVYCGRSVERSEAIEHNGEYYCSDCYDENFTYCEKCGQLVPNDEIRTVVLERPQLDLYMQASMCTECFEKFKHMLQYREIHEDYTIIPSELTNINDIFDLFDAHYTKMAYYRDTVTQAKWDKIFEQLKAEGEEENEE